MYIFKCYYVLEIKNNTLCFTSHFCPGIISLIISWWNCSTASWNLFMHDLIKYNGHPFKKSGMFLFIKVAIFAAIRLDVTYLKKIMVLSYILPQYINWFPVHYCYMIQLNIMCDHVLQYGTIFNFMHVRVTLGTSKCENFVFQEVPFLGNFGFFFGFFTSLQLLADDK